MRAKTRGLLIAFMSAVMLAITATGASANTDAPDIADITAAGITISSGCLDANPTPDNCTVYVYSGSHWFGTVTWNDYYNDDHSRDVDNIYLKDRDGDGYYIRVYATNTYDGEDKANSDAGGPRDTISFSNNIPSGDAAKWKACIKKDGVEGPCTSWKYFWE